jgi:AcrR family transcriptional regulator
LVLIVQIVFRAIEHRRAADFGNRLAIADAAASAYGGAGPTGAKGEAAPRRAQQGIVMQHQQRAPARGRGAKRAKLSQSRSRATRGRIVKAALALWSERGFEEGYSATSVDEIAQRAGMSRATVYYYFAKKEDILRELTWLTAEDVHELALSSLLRGQPVEKVLDEIVAQLARKVCAGDRAAVRRAMQIAMHDHDNLIRDRLPGGMTRALSVVFAHAQDNGELPRHLTSIEIAEVLSMLCTSCINQWSVGVEIDLAAALRRMVAFTLGGARGLAPTESQSSAAN